MEKRKSQHETLSESILFQYAYLEKILALCKQEKHPKEPSQKILRGKDPKYNKSLIDARKAVERVMRMADVAKAECQAAKDDGPIETKPYDQYYYGAIGDI